MTKKEVPLKILIVVNHILEFFILTSILKLIKIDTKKEFVSTLMVKPSVYRKIPDNTKSLFQDIVVVEFPTNPLFIQNKGFRGFIRNVYYIFFRQITDSVKFTRNLRSLAPQVFDIILISSYREYFVNILLKKIRAEKIVALRANDAKLESKNTRKIFSTSFIANVFNFIFGYSLMDYRWHPSYQNIFSSTFKTSPYKKIIHLQYGGVGTNLEKSDQEIFLPFPFLPSLFYSSQESSHTKKILVVGERIPIVPEWNYGAGKVNPNNECQRAYNQFLDYMREQFKDHELYFMPRKEYTDTSIINLTGFEIIPDSITIEELFATTIFEKVISVKSTASKIASCFGYPSYAIFPFLQLSPAVNEHFKNFFADSPNVKMVYKLENLKENATVSVPDTHTIASAYSQVIYGEKDK